MNIYNYLKLITISCCFFSLKFAGSIEITVMDQNKLLPLYGANVRINSLDKLDSTMIGSSTDQNGKSYFKEIEKGTYQVIVEYIGYKKYISNNFKLGSDSFILDVIMKMEALSGPELNIIGGVNTSYNDTPGSASIISEYNIRQVNPIGTQEILDHVAGVHSFSDDGIGNSRISIGIRGLNPRRSSRVLILEDGIPIQPALYVYPNMYYNPPAERIDGLQVIKGSGVIKFGPQTMGGVVNYYTKRPSNDFKGFINATIGQNGYLSLFTELDGLSYRNLKNTIQFLYKRGDGFRENNQFEQYNGTLKTNYNTSNNKNLYSKFSFNYENSQATYTGLTEYSFETDPNFNPKEDDNFEVLRTALDLIETTKVNSNLLKTKKLFSSYFDRRWWRETDIFVSESNLSEELNYQTIEDSLVDDIIRIGNGETNFGILRTFYVLGYEHSYKLNHNFLNFNSISEFGIRTYWERFIDDKVIGDSSDAREGRFYWEPDQGDNVYDLNGNGVYDEFYIHPEYTSIGDLCDTGSDGECDFVDVNNDGIYNLTETRVGQSHHYETAALSGYLSNNIKFGNTSLNTGFRLELFEQERIDLLNGATYLDKTTFVILPSISFITDFKIFNFFGGIHRGYTAPSSGALKVSNFALDTGLDLKAEKSWNKEVGLRSNNLFSFLDFEFSFFHLDIENLVAAGRGTAFKNLGKVETMGTELSSRISFNSYLPVIHLTHTYLKTNVLNGILDKYSFMGSGDPIDISGNNLPYSPKNAFILGLEYNLFNNFNFRFDFKYVDKVFTDFHNIGDSSIRGSWDNIGQIGIRGPIPSYHIVNASFNYNPSKNINMTISGKNLTDEIYIGSRLHSNPNQPKADISSGIIPGARRQINVSVKYLF